MNWNGRFRKQKANNKPSGCTGSYNSHNGVQRHWNRNGWADCEKKVAECKYRHPDRSLTKQFIGRLSDDGMINEILREVTSLENIEEALTEFMLHWACRVEAQRTILNNIKEAKEFDAIWQNLKKWAHGAPHGNKASAAAQGTHPAVACLQEEMWRVWQR